MPSLRAVNLGLLVLLCLLQYRLWFGDGNLREARDLQLRRDALTAEVQKLRERNAALFAEVVDLKEGLDAVEERARQELGMIKSGEVFIQVIEPEPAKRPVPPPVRGAKAPAHAPAPTQAEPPAGD